MKKSSFFKTYMLFVLVLAVPLLLFGSIIAPLTQRQLRATLDRNNRMILNQVKFNTELILNQINQLSLAYDLNSEIGFQLDTGLQQNTSSYNTNRIMNIIKAFSSAESLARPYIHSIYISFDNTAERFFSSTSGITMLSGYIDTDWYTHYKAQPQNKSMWTELREVKRYSFEKPQKVITIYRRTFSRKGIIVLNLLPDYIQSQLLASEQEHNPYLLVLNEEDEILLQSAELPFVESVDLSALCSRANDFFTMKIDGRSYIVNKLSYNLYGWKYLSLVPQESLYQLSTQFTWTLFLVLAVCLVLGLLLALRFTSVQQQYIKLTVSEKLFRGKTFELLALQAQINPHFLFNTLKTIYWKSCSLTDGPNDVSLMIEDLSGILSYSLGSPHEMASVREEIQQTQNYLNIQKIRYHDKFKAELLCDPSLLTVQIPRLILQPIIENCIYHGIKEKEGKSAIRIHVCRRGECIRFTVLDNGAGMDCTTLSDLRRKLEQSGAPEQEIQHIGLFNTVKRIQLKYGKTARVSIRSKRGWGTCVIFELPLEPPESPVKI